MNKKTVSCLILLAILFSFSMDTIAETYYIDFSTGSDTNDGLSRTTPWKRHPYMAGWAGTANFSHSPGDYFIFKGGVTWKNSFPFEISEGGISGNSDYYGVDKTWHNGNAWSRPIFDGEYKVTNIITFNKVKYIILDNIDLQKIIIPSNAQHNIITLIAGQYITMQNLLVHNWKKCSGSGTPYPLCTQAVTCMDNDWGGIYNHENGGPITNLILDRSEVHNADGDGASYGSCTRMIEQVTYSKIHDCIEGVLHGGRVIHDSEFYNIHEPTWKESCPGGWSTHANVAYLDYLTGGAQLPVNVAFYFYNNLVHDTSAGSGAVYPNPGTSSVESGVKYYIFNNVIWNTEMADILVDPYNASSSYSWNVYVFNNTIRKPSLSQQSAGRIARRAGIGMFDWRNNHVIHDNGTFSSAVSDATINQNNVVQTNSQAMSLNYVAGNFYRPVSASSPTVAVGTNLTIMSVNNLSSDRLGVARPTSGPWDVGAYQYISGNLFPPANVQIGPVQ